MRKYTLPGLLLAVLAACVYVSLFAPFQGVGLALFATSGEGAFYATTVRFFAVLGEPSARQVDRYGDLATLVVCIPTVVLLAAVSRLESISRKPRDPETGRRPSGLGWRLLAMRVAAPLLLILGLALGTYAWLSVVRYGAEGDQLATHPHLELSLRLRHPVLGPWLLRQRAYEPRTSAGRSEVVFTFGADVPVKELRVSGDRAEDAVLEIGFVDPHLPPLRVPERECASVNGDLRFRQKRLTTRTGLVPDGALHISCPTHLLEVHAHLVPGYSEHEASEFGTATMVRHANELGIAAAVLLFSALVLALQGFSARYDDRKADGVAELFSKFMAIVVLAGLGLFAFIRTSTSDVREESVDLTPDHVTGCFHVEHRLLGTWHGAPSRCRASRTADFQGVMFELPNHGDVRELRVDTAREGHYTAEFRFFDPNRAPVRVAQSECELFLVPLKLETYGMNARPVDRAYGELHLSCSKLGLEAHVTYRGCES